VIVFLNLVKEIILKVFFESGGEEITILKKCKEKFSPRFYDKNDGEIKNSHEFIETFL
jgi:putative ATP-dependent endonuclease of the OLD family